MASTLEYVASGCSFYRLNYKEAYEGELNKFVHKSFKTLQDVGGHKFSLLYNAHTEKRFGPMIQEHYRKNIHELYSDSGGLQIITLGHEITPALKTAVYTNQAKYSDVAMSFDEIPVKAIKHGRSEKKDTTNRYFDSENFEQRAIDTGKNLLEQIRYFEKEKSETRPLFIVQGNGYDTYMKWSEIALKQIPKAEQARIGGIAMAAAALGTGCLEDCKRAFYFTQLPIAQTIPHLHLLGVGSIQRLIPVMMFISNGALDGIHVSYDSTSHSCGPHMGRYYARDGWHDYTRTRTPIYDTVYRGIKANMPFYNYSIDEMYECLITAAKTYEKKHGAIDPVLKTYVAFISSEIHNFMLNVNEVITKPTAMERHCSPLQMSAFLALRNVKSLKDFQYWEHQAGRYLDSTPIMSQAPASLESLFT